MRTVPLYGAKAAGRVALVDDADYELVMQHRWTFWQDCRRDATRTVAYAMTTIVRDGKYTTTRMHQLITGWKLTDHIDHDGLNNQRSNLRPASSGQNAQHSRSRVHTSQFKGVMWHKKSKRWQARLRTGGVGYELGFYRDEISAARAYDAAAREMYGEFAVLNFPGETEVPVRAQPVPRYPEVPDSLIIELRQSGLTWKKVAAAVGMSESGVRFRWQNAACLRESA